MIGDRVAPVTSVRPSVRWQGFVRLFPLAIVVLGYLATRELIAESLQSEYLAWTGAAVGGLALFATRLGGPLLGRLPRWIIVVVLTVGYLAQFYLMLLDPRAVEKSSAVIASSMTGQNILAAYRQTVTAIWLLAALYLFLDRFPREEPRPRALGSAQGNATGMTLGVTAALLIVTTTLMAAFNVGVVGYAQNLPFRLAGFILHSHRTLIPGLTLGAVMLASAAGQRRWYVFGIGLFVFGAVTDSLLTTTRAALLLAAIRFVVFEAARGALTRRHLAAGAIVVLAASVAFPFITRLRVERGGGATSWSDAVGAAQDEPYISDPDTSAIEAIIRPVAMRFAGGGALVPIIDHGAQVDSATLVEALLGGPGITAYTTRQVFGYPSTDRIGIAPSLLGWLYLADGERGQWIGVLVVGLFLEILWQLVATARLLVRPVLLALIGGQIFQTIGDGTLEGIALPTAVIAGSAVILEFLLRRAVGRAYG